MAETILTLVVRDRMDSDALAKTRFINPPNDACNGRKGMVGTYVAQKGDKKRLEHPRVVETIRTKDTCLVRGRRNHSRVIFGIFSL